MKLMHLALALLAGGLLGQDAEKSQRPMPGPKVGEAAPAFRLNTHEARTVAIGGKRENWTVVAFYPKAMTPG